MAEQRIKSGCILPGSKDFPEHAERMRDFRRGHNGIEGAATGVKFRPSWRLGSISPRGIALRLRKAMN